MSFSQNNGYVKLEKIISNLYIFELNCEHWLSIGAKMSGVELAGDRQSDGELQERAIKKARVIAEAGTAFEYVFEVWQKPQPEMI